MGRLRMKWSYTIETQGIKRLHAHIHACQVVQKNGEAEEDVHLCVEAEEAAVEGQDVAAEGEVVPDAGLQEVQAGVGIYGGAAFLEDGHYAAEDVASGTMLAADGAITLHNSLVTIQLDNAVKNVSAGDTEKDNVSYGQRAGIGQGFQFHGIPVPKDGILLMSRTWSGTCLPWRRTRKKSAKNMSLLITTFSITVCRSISRTIIQS